MHTFTFFWKFPKKAKKVKKITFFQKNGKCLSFCIFLTFFEHFQKKKLKKSLFFSENFTGDRFFDRFYHFSGQKCFWIFFFGFVRKFTTFFAKNFFFSTLFIFLEISGKVKKSFKKIFFSEKGKMPFFFHIFYFFWKFPKKVKKNTFFFWKIHWRPIFFKTFYSMFWIFTTFFEKNIFFRILFTFFVEISKKNGKSFLKKSFFFRKMEECV